MPEKKESYVFTDYDSAQKALSAIERALGIPTRYTKRYARVKVQDSENQKFRFPRTQASIPHEDKFEFDRIETK